MLIIVETILTVVAWRKGWRWKALLPALVGLGFVCFLGFFMGLAMAQSGNSTKGLEGVLFGLGLFTDAGIITVLAVMIRKAPRHEAVAAPAAAAETQPAYSN